MEPKIKPGYKTTEFWLALISSFLPFGFASIPPRYQVLAPAVVSGFYAISRGLAKSGIYKKGDVVADSIATLASSGGVAVAPVDAIQIKNK